MHNGKEKKNMTEKQAQHFEAGYNEYKHLRSNLTKYKGCFHLMSSSL